MSTFIRFAIASPDCSTNRLPEQECYLVVFFLLVNAVKKVFQQRILSQNDTTLACKGKHQFFAVALLLLTTELPAAL